MKSWDCFDTLIARRFFHPTSIFDEVAARIGVPDFTARRISAERTSDQTYQGIYRNLPGIDPDIEQQVEMEHCFPIVENLQQVRDGDIIISDFYNTPQFVESLLRNCGLDRDVKFIVTPAGKNTGKIWPTIKGIELHIGDNYHSDVVRAKENHVPALHYTGSFFTDIEKQIYQIDSHLACWIRYMRLQCPYTGDQKQLWLDQAVGNIPVLALATLELPNSQIAFTARDCIYWQKIFHAMTGRDSAMIWTSRLCYSNPTPEFDRYISEIVKDRIIVDLQGSGRSVKEYFKEDVPMIYLTGPAKESMTGKVGRSGDAIEKHNCVSLGTVIKWGADGPVHATCEHHPIVYTVQKQVIDIACQSVQWFKIKPNLNLIKSLLDLMDRNFTNQNVKHIINHPQPNL